MHAAIENMKATFDFYVSHFSVYDYAALIWVLLVFLTILFLVISVISKHQTFGSILFLLNIIFLFVAVFWSLSFVDSQTRQRKLQIGEIHQLNYTDTVMLDVNLTNLSKKAFRYCKVSIRFYKLSKFDWMSGLNAYIPFKKKSVETSELIHPYRSRNFHFVIENFRPKDYNTSITSECY